MNKIINWDAIIELKKIQDNSIDLIVTDPPYPTISWWKKWYAHKYKWSILEENDWKIFEHNNINIEDYIDDLYRVLKNGSHCYIMTNNKNLHHFLNETSRVWFHLHQVLIWEKWNVTANRRYMKAFEYILFLRKWPAKPIKNKWDSNILKHKNIIWNKLHETEKPVSLFKQMILNSSNEWDLVLDPFAWSCPCDKACKETNRKSICIEIDSKYLN